MPIQNCVFADGYPRWVLLLHSESGVILDGVRNEWMNENVYWFEFECGKVGLFIFLQCRVWKSAENPLTDLELKLDEWQKYWLFPERFGEVGVFLPWIELCYRLKRRGWTCSPSQCCCSQNRPKIAFHSATTDCQRFPTVHFVCMTQIFFLGYNSPKNQHFDLTQNTSQHILKSLEKNENLDSYCCNVV